MNIRFLAPLAALVFFASGCAGPDPRDTQAGYPNGFETEIRTAVQLKTSPKAEDATLLTSVDAKVTELLETQREGILTSAIATYDKERLEDGTRITKENVEVLLEDFAVAAEESAATRKAFEGKVTKFRFVLRRPKARLVPEPTRVESVVFCIERSWAPGDTLRFAQILRAEVMDRMAETIYEVAKSQGLEAVKPRRVNTQ